MRGKGEMEEGREQQQRYAAGCFPGHACLAYSGKWHHWRKESAHARENCAAAREAGTAVSSRGSECVRHWQRAEPAFF